LFGQFSKINLSGRFKPWKSSHNVIIHDLISSQNDLPNSSSLTFMVYCIAGNAQELSLTQINAFIQMDSNQAVVYDLEKNV